MRRDVRAHLQGHRGLRMPHVRREVREGAGGVGVPGLQPRKGWRGRRRSRVLARAARVSPGFRRGWGLNTTLTAEIL